MPETHFDGDLLTKYNQPVPRYTSYPTVPYWNNDIGEEQWKNSFAKTYSQTNHVSGLAIYIHLPFCESLCTYCGCNKKITTNHSVEAPYIDAVLAEWNLYRKLMNQTPVIQELHLGGGTPTFFSPTHLKKLVTGITKNTIIHPAARFSIEGHPNNTTIDHLETLSSLGFRRISFGVQDTDPEVQRVIHRIQPFENVLRATENARSYAFTSVNFDLIYGLPKQTIATIAKTAAEVMQLKPDRIAFYSYAHVPWTSRGQRLFDERDLPTGGAKLALYQTGKRLFLENGYSDIGMDHFSLQTDELYKAFAAGVLRRNFMGYTTHEAGILLGLGVSAISDLGLAFGQNDKSIHGYYESIRKGNIPLRKGTLLTQTDMFIRKYIMDISCQGETWLEDEHLGFLSQSTIPQLEKLKSDNLIRFDGKVVQVTSLGRNFIRNVCAAFDQYLGAEHKADSAFSRAV
jgi:oxygen-independent coproporphyrinogen-3 oxidase